MSSVDQEMVPKAAFDALVEQLSTLQATVDRLTALLEEKNQIILNQNRARFGQSSEKRTYILNDGQLSMFEQAGDGITEKAREDTFSQRRKRYRCQRIRASRNAPWKNSARSFRRKRSCWTFRSRRSSRQTAGH